MNYFERAGSTITKVHELFLRGIKDPRTQFKRYNGQIKGPRGSVTNGTNGSTNTINASYANEVFNYMLIVTDNTGFNVEKSYIIASAQPTTANTSIYQVERGQIGFSEIPVNMNGFPITGRVVNNKAAKMLTYINQATCFDEMEYGYNILTKDNSDIDAIGSTLTSSTVYSNGNIVNKINNNKSREY